MRRHRHHEDDLRLELTPLIDVVFLLLTFFIFSMVVMVRANVLPVELVGIGSGATAGDDAVQAVTVDRDGRYFFNREPVSPEQLVAELSALAERPDPPRVYVGVEDQPGAVDRGPVLIELMELLRRAGITDVAFVGPPQ